MTPHADIYKMWNEEQTASGRRLWDNEESADLTIHCGLFKYRVHTTILDSRSSFLKHHGHMIKGNETSGKYLDLDPQNHDNDGLGDFLKWIYTGHCSLSPCLSTSPSTPSKDDLPPNFLPYINAYCIATKYRVPSLRTLAVSSLRITLAQRPGFALHDPVTLRYAIQRVWITGSPMVKEYAEMRNLLLGVMKSWARTLASEEVPLVWREEVAAVVRWGVSKHDEFSEDFWRFVGKGEMVGGEQATRGEARGKEANGIEVEGKEVRWAAAMVDDEAEGSNPQEGEGKGKGKQLAETFVDGPMTVDKSREWRLL